VLSIGDWRALVQTSIVHYLVGRQSGCAIIEHIGGDSDVFNNDADAITPHSLLAYIGQR
jgi:hypothetical protein